MLPWIRSAKAMTSSSRIWLSCGVVVISIVIILTDYPHLSIRRAHVHCDNTNMTQ